MKMNYTAPRADLTCFEPWENVALVDLGGSGNGDISFGDLWAAANPGSGGGPSGGVVKLPGDISIPV